MSGVSRCGEKTILPNARPFWEFLTRCSAPVALVTILAMSARGASAQESAALSLTVLEESVAIANVTRGGSVVLFMCERGSRNGRTHVRKQALMLRDDDGDGTLHFTPESKVALRSVWIAVDFESGATAAAAQSRFPLILNEIPTTRFKKDAEGVIAELEQELRRMFLLLVRPGTGAWTLLARDGKAGDSDRAENARLTLRFADARAIEGEAAAPKHLKKNDVLVAIDQSRLDVYLAHIEN